MSKLSANAPQLTGKNLGSINSETPSSTMSNSDLLSALGSSVSMPAPVQAKMENSFGMSLSDVSLYESPLVSQNGAEAVASGSKIAFAPGKLNPFTGPGQELLGHELSHVVAQKRGEVSGSGFLNDSSLERRADREGALAAKGSTVFDSETSGALSPMSESSAPSSGPMQAKKPDVEYTPSASEQFNDRIGSLADTKNAQHTNLSEIALQRSLMSQQEQPQQFDPEYEAAYQKRISSMNTEEMTSLLSQHSQKSAYLDNLLKSNRDFYYYDSLANTQLGEQGSEQFSKGMVNYNMRGANTADQFLGYESLLRDIQANPDSLSAQNLAKLTGEGGQFQHMEGVENMRNLMDMSDNDVDASMQMRNYTKNKAPIAGIRQQKDAETLQRLQGDQQHFARNKTRAWWQFWK